MKRNIFFLTLLTLGFYETTFGQEFFGKEKIYLLTEITFDSEQFDFSDDIADTLYKVKSEKPGWAVVGYSLTEPQHVSHFGDHVHEEIAMASSGDEYRGPFVIEFTHETPVTQDKFYPIAPSNYVSIEDWKTSYDNLIKRANEYQDPTTASLLEMDFLKKKELYSHIKQNKGLQVVVEPGAFGPEGDYRRMYDKIQIFVQMIFVGTPETVESTISTVRENYMLSEQKKITQSDIETRNAAFQLDLTQLAAAEQYTQEYMAALLSGNCEDYLSLLPEEIHLNQRKPMSKSDVEDDLCEMTAGIQEGGLTLKEFNEKNFALLLNKTQFELLIGRSCEELGMEWKENMMVFIPSKSREPSHARLKRMLIPIIIEQIDGKWQFTGFMK